MDRNLPASVLIPPTMVALRKESVDRNLKAKEQLNAGDPSLSARRAWIEICLHFMQSTGAPVALRKESVDRNIDLHILNKK